MSNIKSEGGETMAGMNVERNIFNHLMEVMDRLEKVERESKKQHQADQERIRELEKKVAEQAQTIERLNNEIDRLKHKDDKDSHNSSLPPSSDQRPTKKAPNEYNSRQKSGKKSGGQAGHKGRTLILQDTLKKLEELDVIPEIEEIGDPSMPYKERLILDVSCSVHATLKRFHEDEDGRIHIPYEYRSEVTYGDRTKSLVALLYGQGVESAERIVEIIRAITNQGITLSQGSVFNWLEELFSASARECEGIEKRLLDQKQVCTDATNITVDGKQTYVRNFSSANDVLYVPMEKKDLVTLGKIPFLQKFVGILVHDHETALFHFGQNHAECNVHMIRYLTANSENTGHKWSSSMISLLREMNQYRKRLIAQGQSHIPPGTLLRLEMRYDALLEQAQDERKQRPSRFRWAMKDEKTLLNRLKRYKVNHLLFLRDFDIPFDNNMSERDLRKCKNRQKMAGGFRTNRGKQIFCAILSITETCKRRGMNLVDAFLRIFSNQPLFA